jgi:Na+/melibiose symporter-like transporter
MVADTLTPPAPARRGKIGLGVKLAFSMGSLETAIVAAAGVTTLVYYNQVLGLSPALGATAASVSTTIDAFIDPLVGALSDGVRTRWGRRHPFMFAAAFLVPGVFYLLYQPPQGLSEFGLFLWMTVFLTGVGVCRSIFLVPQSALGAELSDDYYERTSIFGWNYIVGAIGTVLLTALVLIVIFPSMKGLENGLLNAPRYQWLAIGGAIACFVVVFGCTMLTAKQIPYLHRRETLGASVRNRYIQFGRETWTNFRSLATNPSYISIYACWLILAISGGILAVVSTYTFLYALGLTTEQLSIRSFVTLPGAFVGVPLAGWLVRRLDKKWTVVLTNATTTSLLSAPFILKLLGWMPANHSIALFVVLFAFWGLGYMTLPVVPIVIDSQLVDVADDHELKTGNRAEGQIFSIRTFAVKLSNGLGLLLGGIGLQVIHFPRHAHAATLAPQVVTGLLWLSGPVYWMIVAAGVGFVLLYRIDRKRHAEILAELGERRRQRGAPAEPGALEAAE